MLTKLKGEFGFRSFHCRLNSTFLSAKSHFEEVLTASFIRFHSTVFTGLSGKKEAKQSHLPFITKFISISTNLSSAHVGVHQYYSFPCLPQSCIE